MLLLINRTAAIPLPSPQYNQVPFLTSVSPLPQRKSGEESTINGHILRISFISPAAWLCEEISRVRLTHPCAVVRWKGVCNSVLIANGDSNIVHPPPLRNTEGSPQQAGGQSSQSNISSLQGGSPILPAQTVFQPTREMYPPSPAGSPFIPFTPVPGVPGSDRASIKKEYRGSRSSETFALPRRQISPRSRSQEPSNPMADANSPPSENLLPSSSVTFLPTPTTSRGRFGLDYDGYSLIQLAARDTRFGPMAQFGTATTTPIPTGGIRTGEMVAWPAV